MATKIKNSFKAFGRAFIAAMIEARQRQVNHMIALNGWRGWQ
jgi:hypothetical protein